MNDDLDKRGIDYNQLREVCKDLVGRLYKGTFPRQTYKNRKGEDVLECHAEWEARTNSYYNCNINFLKYAIQFLNGSDQKFFNEQLNQFKGQ